MPFRHAFNACTLALTCLTASLAMSLAQPAPAPPVTEVALDTGLRILALEDHRNRIAIIQTWYKVGSRNEVLRATGLAHFLEHIMLKGTPTHGRGSSRASWRGTASDVDTRRVISRMRETFGRIPRGSAHVTAADIRRVETIDMDPATFLSVTVVK